MRKPQRLFRRPRHGPSLFGVVAAFALAGALVLAFSPAHAPSPGHSHLQAHAAQLAPPVATAIASPVLVADAPSSPVAAKRRPRTCPNNIGQHTCFYAPGP